MGPLMSPAKVVLLAVHLAAHADLDNLLTLAAREATVLRRDLLLRILLTHLPETVNPSAYVDFLQCLHRGHLESGPDTELDLTPIELLSEEHAARRVTKLRLLKLPYLEAPVGDEDDLITLFLFHRAYRVNEEAGLLAQLPQLIFPFLQYSPAIRAWAASTVIPLLRRNCEYYPHDATPYTLVEFQKLPDRTALEYLLSRTGQNDEIALVGRDLRGMVAPWLYNDARWRDLTEKDPDTSLDDTITVVSCPGWEHVREWLLLQASKSWRVAVAVIEQWNGPRDVDLPPEITLQHPDLRWRYLDNTYIRAAIASAYLISEPTVDALEGAYRIAGRAVDLLQQEPLVPLHDVVAHLPDLVFSSCTIPLNAKLTAYIRNDLLQEANPLTAPTSMAARLLMFLVVSAFLSTRLGMPCTVRKAGDLAILKDERDQKGEVAKLIRIIATNGLKQDDEYWARSRQEILWLHGWGLHGQNGSKGEAPPGIFGEVPQDFIETEFLKALLASSRYALARQLYEDGDKKAIPKGVVQDVVYNTALNAFDNASNPNRTRGGLKKCDEIMNALPKTMDDAAHMKKRVEALLRATHALSDYRLVLRQGEPFSPVVLRVHSDPIIIIDKIFEQNPRAYTRLQEFLETGINMVRAGLITRNRVSSHTYSSDNYSDEVAVVEKRIVAMCIEAALREDDFETAYSYVVSRLGSSIEVDLADEWSWSAAVKAGQYVRTERSMQPTHLGTASGNLEVRHLEQRLECLATALRIAPPSQLQEILSTFRRCEEQLDSAIQEEAAREAAWDTAGDMSDLPGGFDTPEPPKAYPPRNSTASSTARQAEEAPMSLFDLSRATARAAQKNFSALSSLQVTNQDKPQSPETAAAEADQYRVRKRDQFRDAATETLVSGVGWLIGANVPRGRPETG